LDIPVARGTKRLRHALALALLAAGAGGAWATHLDKIACADLNTELLNLLASGLKEDMDKGAAWASANLSPERLVSINRVIELQGQIEFRCGSPPSHNVAKSPNGKPGDKSPPAKAADGKASTAKSTGEDADDAAAAAKPKARTLHRKRGSAATITDVPSVIAATTSPAGKPARVNTQPTAPTTLTPAQPAPELDKTAGTTAPAAAQPPQASKVTPASTAPQAASAARTAAIGPVTAPTPAPPGHAAATAPGAQKTAASKKSSRRDTASAYVSPKDVNTNGLPTDN
jgi:hypothetical protein